MITKTIQASPVVKVEHKVAGKVLRYDKYECIEHVENGETKRWWLCLALGVHT